MAHESFEDPQVAQVMNELFVNIKVDREERPDVDKIYMVPLFSTTTYTLSLDICTNGIWWWRLANVSMANT